MPLATNDYEYRYERFLEPKALLKSELQLCMAAYPEYFVVLYFPDVLKLIDFQQVLLKKVRTQSSRDHTLKGLIALFLVIAAELDRASRLLSRERPWVRVPAGLLKN